MINKFQQGGQLQINLLLLDLIYDRINNAPEETLKQLVQSGVTPEAISELVTLGIQQGKIKPEIGEAILNAIKNQSKIAKRGAKLNYIKSLKHQCAEDEELYYYKKGGKAGCGCRKKEDGGEILKAQPGAVARFKLSRKPNPYASEAEKKFLALRDKDRLALANKELQKEKENQAKNKKAFELAEKDDGWHVANNGDAYPPAERGRKPVVKKSCGSKLKKHFNGGSLNRIPFLEKVLGKTV